MTPRWYVPRRDARRGPPARRAALARLVPPRRRRPDDAAHRDVHHPGQLDARRTGHGAPRLGRVDLRRRCLGSRGRPRRPGRRGDDRRRPSASRAPRPPRRDRPGRPTSTVACAPVPAATCTTPCCRRSWPSGSPAVRPCGSGGACASSSDRPRPARTWTLRLPPDPQRLTRRPAWWFHPLGIEAKRARPLAEVGRLADRLWDWVEPPGRPAGGQAGPRPRHRAVDDRVGARPGVRRRRCRPGRRLPPAQRGRLEPGRRSARRRRPRCSRCSPPTSGSAAVSCGS